jgi:hypothetical protein
VRCVWVCVNDQPRPGQGQGFRLNVRSCVYPRPCVSVSVCCKGMVMSPPLFEPPIYLPLLCLCFTPAAPRHRVMVMSPDRCLWFRWVVYVHPRPDVFGLGMCLCGRGLTVSSARDGFCVGGSVYRAPAADSARWFL